jgi:cytochrome c oxidase subunit II
LAHGHGCGRRDRRVDSLLAFLLAGLVTACGGEQSSLNAAGAEARHVEVLFWAMTIGGSLIWTGVLGAFLFAARADRRAWSQHAAGRLILWAGVAFPVLALAALLTYALWLMPALRPWTVAEPTTLSIEVTARQYWWEVRYRQAGGEDVVSANEVRVPVGERVEFVLESPDVIHSFWIPPLGGKMDMIPGRTNRLSLQTDRAGTFRGQCAEYCGVSHALMAFTVLAMPAAEFQDWLEDTRRPAEGANRPAWEIFEANGCGACHAVRGTAAVGVVGPDLSHLGGRGSIGAGVLPMSAASIARFITEPEAVKPGVAMPGYPGLAPADLDALASYLEGLR